MDTAHISYVLITVITIVANGGIAVADLARAEFVLANSAAVGVPRSWLPWLGGLKGAGALGLLAGLTGAQALGVAAAVGLVLFFVGAVAAHVRARAYATMAGPAGYLGLAAASLVLAVLH
ncbi:DoxX family protein [Streptomyces sp. NPDC020883]|uniref:DoxX family protein n=1 Tax=Streptomyces sp. NPDC020883 TaxID=3365099 RepID=UPI003791503D